MRVHIHREALALLRKAETPATVRRAVERLGVDPFPEWSYVLENHPGRREFFEAGYWVVYEVEKGSGETVVRVLVIEANE